MAAIPYMTCKRVDSKLKERNERLLLGYPELINRFLLLLGAGSSMKGAWERLVYYYMKKKESDNSYYDYVYEEMRYSLSELKRGISEILVYERFGRRVRLMPYMKLCSMLSQNLRRGNRYILDQLKLSSLDAYEKKRENIRRGGFVKASSAYDASVYTCAGDYYVSGTDVNIKMGGIYDVKRFLEQ